MMAQKFRPDTQGFQMYFQRKSAASRNMFMRRCTTLYNTKQACKVMNSAEEEHWASRKEGQIKATYIVGPWLLAFRHSLVHEYDQNIRSSDVYLRPLRVDVSTSRDGNTRWLPCGPTSMSVSRSPRSVLDIPSHLGWRGHRQGT